MDGSFWPICENFTNKNKSLLTNYKKSDTRNNIHNKETLWKVKINDNIQNIIDIIFFESLKTTS